MRTSPLALLAASLLAAPAAAQPAAARERAPETVAVSGTGRVELTPDRAVFTVGVEAVGTTVAGALQETSARTSAIVAALRRLGAEDREIRTSHVSVYPRQEVGNRPPRITGYQVSNAITVTRDDPAAVGKLLQAAVDAGANTVSGVGFMVSDPARGRDAGLQAAFADARAKAELLARAAGRTLGRAISITEGGGFPPPAPMMAGMAQARAVEVPVESGAEERSFTVSVVFELR
jgi:uncharacterized protein YggE